jgi:hypothetical protein
VMLYYMLTGVVPFDHDNPMDILVAHLQQPPRPFALANPTVEVPQALEQVVMRCLAKTPQERFADMQELQSTLRTIAKNVDARARASLPSANDGRDPAASGVRATQATHSLRLEANDAAGPSRPSLGLPTSRANGAFIAAIVCVLLLGAFVAWRVHDHDAAAAKSALPMSEPANSVPAAPAPAPVAPTMVFTPEEAANDALPRVQLRVSSEPPGASVLLRGKWIGTTPLSFEWRDAHAQHGAPLVVQLKREGYAPYTIKRTIDATDIDLSATLEPAPRAIEPKQPDVDPGALQARAPMEANGAEAPVLKITPAKPENEAEPQADEPDNEEPEAEPSGKASQ